ncbi:formate dehydrogenase accessory sulfurtransferase FdhD [Fulvimarina sp. 2208YS6-2-32]|uniref:Sulfur carrier protein FdhD n=1 Tax=Fulvimarina uroteuthidis TaxID=3098149 RepID=A0ABU5HX13_9HYPH|nr:formate dehydrogenase accessory sulfurtransferase FdhD [Fulvimarina sp. 2208YS6-2-32]MDY8107570.1 formate dehydrogenase accessory sulfurtransferase FdhD [Fulvimarina sp. 2208YS6-2-32]
MPDGPEFTSVTSLAFRGGVFVRETRSVPAERAVAISIGGSTHAVMMATPSHVEELGVGLALNEAIVDGIGEIEAVEIVETEAGIDCQIRLVPQRAATYVARRRQMTGPVGCGLCGVESLELAGRVLPVVRDRAMVAPARLREAMADMATGQHLSKKTRAVHAAAFHDAAGAMIVLREDVGRHNALDKVTGHLARRGVDPAPGFLTMTSRVSVELIQKAASMGCGLIAAISAPTELAIDEARAANVTLAAIVRGDEFEIFTCPERIEGAVDALDTDGKLRA